MVTLILVLAAVSSVVCLMIDRDADTLPFIRTHAARIGRAAMVAALRSARATVAGLLRADDLIRSHRRIEDVPFHQRPAAVAVETPPSRLLALIELLILAALTGAAIAVALAGLAWGAAKLMT
jgi:hypothetical protein